MGSVCSYMYRNPQNCVHTRVLLPPPLKRANAISCNCREAASVCYLPRFKATIQYPPSVFIKALLTLTPEQPKPAFWPAGRSARVTVGAGRRAGDSGSPSPPAASRTKQLPRTAPAARLRSLHPGVDRLGEKPQPKALRLSFAKLRGWQKRKFSAPKAGRGKGRVGGKRSTLPLKACKSHTNKVAALHSTRTRSSDLIHTQLCPLPGPAARLIVAARTFI